ncbi:MAG: DUF1593 domain-containing protein [Bacteroidales bacterium]|nr:DUF1593 domain-containing protein [Bacteroidales bacterium]
MRKLTMILAAILAFGCNSNQTGPSVAVRPRTVITTDGEVDDYDSFIRLLLYSNEMDIQAIVYSASQWHWAGDGQGTPLLPENRWEGPREGMAGPQFDAPKPSHRWIGMDWIPGIIDAYAQCYDNLVRHDARYPSPDYLRSIVKVGNIRVEGDMSDPTEGSEYIKGLLLDDTPGPLYLQIWGGTNTVARALLDIAEQYKDTPEWETIYRKVSDKAVLYIIQDQDGTYRNYVEANWPEIRAIYNGTQFFGFAYLWKRATPRPFQEVLTGKWFREHIVQDKGALGALYMGAGIPYPFLDPEDHYGDPESVERNPGADFNDFISEGDSPSYFYLFDFMGLRSLEHPEWGGIGGRFDEIRPHFWKDARDYNPFTGEMDIFYPQMRWTEVLQNDFAARIDWCIKDYADANHAPAASVSGAHDRTVKPGEKVMLKGSATDPDRDTVSLSWWQYREAGTSDAKLALESADGAVVRITIPQDAKPGETFHLILEAKDSGNPELRHFQRVILTVEPGFLKNDK